MSDRLYLICINREQAERMADCAGEVDIYYHPSPDLPAVPYAPVSAEDD